MDTRPCSVCGGGDDEGTMLACVECNNPFHNCIHCAGFITGCDYGDWLCLDCTEHQGNEDEEEPSGLKDEEGGGLKEKQLPRVREVCAVVYVN